MEIFGINQVDAVEFVLIAFFWGIILGNVMGLIRYMVWGVNEPAYKL